MSSRSNSNRIDLYHIKEHNSIMLNTLINTMAAITGHTGSIGGGIGIALQDRGFTIKGFSLENGYDLSEPGTIRRIVDESEDCSIFVNCAQHGFSQVEILYALLPRDGRPMPLGGCC